jgi:hypothetical protein
MITPIPIQPYHRLCVLLSKGYVALPLLLHLLLFSNLFTYYQGEEEEEKKEV